MSRFLDQVPILMQAFALLWTLGGGVLTKRVFGTVSIGLGADSVIITPPIYLYWLSVSGHFHSHSCRERYFETSTRVLQVHVSEEVSGWSPNWIHCFLHSVQYIRIKVYLRSWVPDSCQELKENNKDIKNVKCKCVFVFVFLLFFLSHSQKGNTFNILGDDSFVNPPVMSERL